jgi:hypothetical protein
MPPQGVHRSERRESAALVERIRKGGSARRPKRRVVVGALSKKAGLLRAGRTANASLFHTHALLRTLAPSKL